MNGVYPFLIDSLGRTGALGAVLLLSAIAVAQIVWTRSIAQSGLAASCLLAPFFLPIHIGYDLVIVLPFFAFARLSSARQGAATLVIAVMALETSLCLMR